MICNLMGRSHKILGECFIKIGIYFSKLYKFQNTDYKMMPLSLEIKNINVFGHNFVFVSAL